MRWTKRKENDRRPEGVPKPSIPTLGKIVPAGAAWIHEVKHDGYRLMVRRDGDDVLTVTRGGYDWTIRYPAIATAARELAVQRFVIDGEGVLEGDGGVADFKLLHSRKHDRRCYLFAFDLLELGDRDLRPLPLEMRKQLLAHLLQGSTSGIVYAEHFERPSGAAAFDAACKMGLEGIVSKRKDKAYASGTCKHWIKIKNPDAPWKARLEETQ